MSTTVLNPVFRLKSWTVRKSKDKFYISCEEHPSNWGRAYASLKHACNAICESASA